MFLGKNIFEHLYLINISPTHRNRAKIAPMIAAKVKRNILSICPFSGQALQFPQP
jgi:hypothetical protein